MVKTYGGEQFGTAKLHNKDVKARAEFPASTCLFSLEISFSLTKADVYVS